MKDDGFFFFWKSTCGIHHFAWFKEFFFFFFFVSYVKFAMVVTTLINFHTCHVALIQLNEDDVCVVGICTGTQANLQSVSQSTSNILVPRFGLRFVAFFRN